MTRTYHAAAGLLAVGVSLTCALAGGPTNPSAGGPAGAPVKPKIGIAKFEIATDPLSRLGPGLYSRLHNQVALSRECTVVSAAAMDRVLKEVSGAQPNLSAYDAKRRMIKQLGIDTLYVGSLTQAEGKYSVVVNVVNGDLGVEWSARMPSGTIVGLDRAIDTISTILLSRLTADADGPQPLYPPEALEQLKALLGSDAGEWKVIERILEGLLTAQNDVRKARGVSPAAFVAVPSADWQRPAAGTPAGDLVVLLQSRRPDPAEIKPKLEAFRKTRLGAVRKAEEDARKTRESADLAKRLKVMQDGLRPFLSPRQEATMVVEGLLN